MIELISTISDVFINVYFIIEQRKTFATKNSKVCLGGLFNFKNVFYL